MFGFGEIMIIFGLALVVLGPKKLPGVAAQVGRWLGRARAMARQFREQLEQEVNAATDYDSAPRRRSQTTPTATPSATADPQATEAPAAGDATAQTPADHRDLAGDHSDLGSEHRDPGGEHRDLGAAPTGQEAASQPADASTHPPPEVTQFPSDPTKAPAPSTPEPQAHDHAAHPELEVYAPAAPPSRDPAAS